MKKRHLCVRACIYVFNCLWLRARRHILLLVNYPKQQMGMGRKQWGRGESGGKKRGKDRGVIIWNPRSYQTLLLHRAASHLQLHSPLPANRAPINTRDNMLEEAQTLPKHFAVSTRLISTVQQSLNKQYPHDASLHILGMMLRRRGGQKQSQKYMDLYSIHRGNRPRRTVDLWDNKGGAGNAMQDISYPVWRSQVNGCSTGLQSL